MRARLSASAHLDFCQKSYAKFLDSVDKESAA